MAVKIEQYTESKAIAAIDAALTSLPDEDSRHRVLDWAVAKFGGGPRGSHVPWSRSDGDSRAESEGSTGDETTVQFGSRATAWMKKHRVTTEMLDAAFHLDGESSSLILRSLPGDSKRERVGQVAALLGALALVRTDQARFSANELRDGLKQYDAYDRANNSTYVKSHNNIVQGNAENGYTATATGLDLAARLLAATSDG